jgi:hypothetical protein
MGGLLSRFSALFAFFPVKELKEVLTAKSAENSKRGLIASLRALCFSAVSIPKRREPHPTETA